MKTILKHVSNYTAWWHCYTSPVWKRNVIYSTVDFICNILLRKSKFQKVNMVSGSVWSALIMNHLNQYRRIKMKRWTSWFVVSSFFFRLCRSLSLSWCSSSSCRNSLKRAHLFSTWKDSEKMKRNQMRDMFMY